MDLSASTFQNTASINPHKQTPLSMPEYETALSVMGDLIKAFDAKATCSLYGMNCEVRDTPIPSFAPRVDLPERIEVVEEEKEEIQGM